MQAPNCQGAAIWRYNDTDKVYFNVSDRDPLPDHVRAFQLAFWRRDVQSQPRPERAINFDLGWSSEFAPGSRIRFDVFHSIVGDLIQSVPAPHSA